MIRMEGGSDLLTDFAPQDFKVLAGIRAIGGSDMLLLKFSRRGNIKSGCILRRPCLCDEASILARIFRPVHMFWPLIRARC